MNEKVILAVVIVVQFAAILGLSYAWLAASSERNILRAADRQRQRSERR